MVLRRRAFWAISWGLGFAWGMAAEPAAQQVAELRTQLQRALMATHSTESVWGVQVSSAHSGSTWFATNAGSLFIPASNTKLFTAALALDRLGGDYRWITSLYRANPVSASGELKGDLLVVGSGDPTLCGRLHEGNWEKAFAPLVDAVRMAGIHRIAGSLVCDESRFRGTPYGSGWEWDDLAQYYGAAVSALSAEDNAVHVVVASGAREGDPATIRLEPADAGLSVRSQVVTGPTNVAPTLELARLPGDSSLTVTGSIPLNSGARIEEASVPQPARWFGELFRLALQRAGIELTGSVKIVSAAERIEHPFDDSVWREFAAVPSPPGSDVVREMMKPSQNLYAQLLLLSVGAETERYPQAGETPPPEASTTEALGLRALGRLLRHIGIPENEVVLEEGSGLSRKNLITPRATVRLLEFMNHHRWSTAWRATFPIGGVDGTLNKRFNHPPTQGNVQAKTGSLRYVGALSGYLTNRVGEPIIFSILVNNYTQNRPGTSARAEIDQLVELIAQSEIKERAATSPERKLTP